MNKAFGNTVSSKRKKNDPQAGLTTAIARARRIFSSTSYPVDELFPGRWESPDPKSVTIPDQSYSVQELFQRSRNGLTVPSHQGVYSEEDIAPFEKMDFAERVNFLNNLTEYRAEIEAKFKSEDAARKQAEAKAKVEATQQAEADLIEKIRKEANP